MAIYFLEIRPINMLTAINRAAVADRSNWEVVMERLG